MAYSLSQNQILTSRPALLISQTPQLGASFIYNAPDGVTWPAYAVVASDGSGGVVLATKSGGKAIGVTAGPVDTTDAGQKIAVNQSGNFNIDALFYDSSFTTSASKLALNVPGSTLVFGVAPYDNFVDSDEDEDDILVTGVTLAPTTLSVAVGATGTLTATVSPADADDSTVLYSSSDETIATVSASGVVTGVADGTAVITATTVDGGYTATSTVTVAAATVAVTGVSVTPTTVSVAVGATTDLTATVAPTNATNQAVTWSSADDAIVSVSADGVVTGVASGFTQITATTADGGFTASSTVTATAS